MDTLRKAARNQFDAAKKKLDDILTAHNKLAVEIARTPATDTAHKKADELAVSAAQAERELSDLESGNERKVEDAILGERRKILDDIAATIKAWNKEQRYNLILDRSATSANGIPSVVDYAGVTDITGDIVRILAAKSKLSNAAK